MRRLTESSFITRRLPLNVTADDLPQFSHEQSFTLPESYLVNLSNVWVTPDSVIFKNGILLDQSLPENLGKRYFRTTYLAKQMIRSKKVRLPSGVDYLLVTDLESSGHFHWFAEVLPKLISAREYVSQMTLLLPDTQYVRQVGLDSLKAIGLEFREIILMKAMTSYKVPDLKNITPNARVGLNDEIFRRMQVALHSPSGRNDRRLYVSRSKGRFRKVLNETEVTTCLKRYGFEVVYPEELSFNEQRELFSSASVIAGIHGAGLTNCVFMKRGGTVIEFRKYELANTGYWHLADSLGHRYIFINGTPDSDKSVVGQGCNILIDVDKLKEELIGCL